MLNQPDSSRESQPLSGKLVLPAYPDEDYQSPRMSQPLPVVPVRPEQLIQRATPPPPRPPLAKLRYFWGKDPAYKVLLIAIGTVLLAGLLFLTLVGSTLLRNANSFASGNALSQTPPAAVIPTGTVVLHPTFPPPSGGKGTGTSSQPPTQTTPVLQSTATGTPTQPAGQLSVQLSGVPNRVQNYSAISLTIITNEPNVTVSLVVTYNVFPYHYTSGSHTTDGSGNASVYWRVNVYLFGRHALAQVSAQAMDQNGQSVQSQTFTVQIVGGYGG